MAIAFRAKNSAQSTASVSSLTVTKPSGTADGDLLLLVISHSGDVNGTAPDSTWLRAPGGYRQSNSSPGSADAVLDVFYKFASSEGASYSVGVSASSANWAASISAFSGVDATIPFEACAGLHSVSNASAVTIPSVTTFTANTLLLGIVAHDGGTPTYTPPAGMTERVDINADHSSSNTRPHTLAELAVAAASATGVKTFTASAADRNCSLALVLRQSGSTGIAGLNVDTDRDSADLSVYTTNKVSIRPNRLGVVFIYARKGSASDTPTVTGGGCGTWTLEDSQAADATAKLFCFRAMSASSGAAEALTITFSGAQTSVGWQVTEYDGVNTSGTNGSGAVLQSVPSTNNPSSSASATLAAFGSVNNATAAGMSADGSVTFTAGTGFAVLGQVGGGSTASTVGSEFKPTNDTSVDWTSSVSDALCTVAIEIKAASAVQTVSPTGIGTAEALGTPTITVGGVTLSPIGIASAEAFGTATIGRGAVTISGAGGIASGEAFGTPTVQSLGTVISPTGIASGEALGTPTITVGGVTVSPVGIGSGEAFGLPSIAFAQIVVPVGIASAEVLGTPTVTPGARTITPTGITSGEAIGSPTLTTGGVTVSPVGITSAEAFGSPTVSVAQVSAQLTSFLDPATKLIVKVEAENEGSTTSGRGLGR